MHTKLAFLVVLAGISPPAPAADYQADEYRVKGAFLLNFTKFVEWPAQAFPGAKDPISICILGTNPFTPALDAAAHEIVVDSRSVTVHQVAELQQARGCHILFVSASERKRVKAVLEALQGANVLTVGETSGFVSGGGVIEFKVEDSKVRMEISTAGAKRAGLHVSAKLLSLAQSDSK